MQIFTVVSDIKLKGYHTIGCANRDLDGYLGALGKFIEY
jgi:hypothetical protein